jgi:hypothetical protein
MELNTKSELLNTIRAHRAGWEALLAEIGEERMLEPGATGDWNFKDVAAHLTGWRLRTIARLEAAQRDASPSPPPWPLELDEVDDDDVQVINQWIYRHNHDRPLSEVLAEARESLRRVEEGVETLSEQDLFDPDRFAWMGGFSIAAAVSGSLGHYEEHEMWIKDWLESATGR